MVRLGGVGWCFGGGKGGWRVSGWRRWCGAVRLVGGEEGGIAGVYAVAVATATDIAIGMVFVAGAIFYPAFL